MSAAVKQLQTMRMKRVDGVRWCRSLPTDIYEEGANAMKKEYMKPSVLFNDISFIDTIANDASAGMDIGGEFDADDILGLD